MSARKVTPEEFEKGYVVCDCGKYAHVFCLSVLRDLPKDCGEQCGECDLFMVPIKHLVASARREKS